VVEAKRNLARRQPEDRQQMQALPDDLPDPLGGELAVGGSRRVNDRERADISGVAAVLEIQAAPRRGC